MSVYSGLRGKELAVAIAITPLLVPFWIILIIRNAFLWTWEHTLGPWVEREIT